MKRGFLIQLRRNYACNGVLGVATTDEAFQWNALMDKGFSHGGQGQN